MLTSNTSDFRWRQEKLRMPLKTLTIYNYYELYQNQFSNLISKSEKAVGWKFGNILRFFNNSQLTDNCQPEFNRFKLYMK